MTLKNSSFSSQTFHYADTRICYTKVVELNKKKKKKPKNEGEHKKVDFTEKTVKKLGFLNSGLSRVSENDFKVIYTKWEKSM